jgi:hypothetical protein
MTPLPSPRKRGRPSKFGRPSEVVALTLPTEVIEGLRSMDSDLAWAIVRLFEKRSRRASAPNPQAPDTELASIAGHRFLIVVNRAVVRNLPGIQVVPLDADRAFLALEPGSGMAELEIAVVDRLEDRTIPFRERRALKALRLHLREWRLDSTLRFHTRAIIVAEQVRGSRKGRSATRLTRTLRQVPR